MKGMHSTSGQKGFTIIELVVVILLLGILTATALPRFMDVTDDAHDAVVSGVVGGFATSLAMYRAQWYADNQPNTVAEFGSLNANGTGYPVGDVATPADSTVVSSVGISSNCIEIFQNLLQPAGQPTIKRKAQTSTVVGSLTTLTTGTYDFVAWVRNNDNTNKNVCYYFYTGQFNNIATGAVPAITYDAKTGTVTTSEL